MTETFISKTRVAAVIAWTVVVLLMASGVALLAFTPYWRWAGMTGGLACASSAVAATLSIKLYAMRLCALVRVTAGLDGSQDGLRPIR